MNAKTKIFAWLFAIACFAVGIGLYFVIYKPAEPKAITVKPVSIINQVRPEFSLKDINGKSRDIKEWNGKVILLNFWATWCPPCRHEIPAFISLYQKYHDKGLVVVGVALDTKQNAIDFLDPMEINYPILIGEQNGIALTQKYGNDLGVLPYSVIIDRKGIIRDTVAHAMTLQQSEKLITPLL